MRWLPAALAALIFASPSGAAETTRSGYVPDGRLCGGYPRAPIETAPGMCAGLVFAPPPEGLRPSKRALRLPREILPLPNGDLLVSDLGSWEAHHGAVWRLTPQPGGPPKLTRLLSGLDLPHTLRLGPDGRVYLGEMSRIERFDPDADDPGATIEVVVDQLPDNRLHTNRHPLSSFIFDGDGALLVNVGAPSDQCPPKPGHVRCVETEAERPQGAVWRFAYLGDGRWAAEPTVFARGLRNSLAMVRHPSGVILQGENSIDIDDPERPYDEINRLQPGRHYGWPYCVDAAETAPAWRGKSPVECRGPANTPPVLLLPPHSAPLDMLYYSGPIFPELSGKLIVSLHGYRHTGARLIAYDVDAHGLPIAQRHATYAVYGLAERPPHRRPYRSGPAANGLILTPGWFEKAGERPSGSPVGLAVTPDGALWVADDRNGAILRFVREAP